MTDYVPILSLTQFTEGDAEARRAFSTAVMQAFRATGFLKLKDHNLSPAELAAAYSEAEALFGLPEPVKRRYAAGLRGYTPFGVEHAKDSALPDLKEFWQVGREPPAGIMVDEDLPPNVWPEELPGVKSAFERLYAGLDETGRLLLRALAPELGEDEGFFDEKIRYGTSILRVLHYPPVAADTPPGSVRSAAHEDINFITIMVPARGAGLEIQTRDGSWLPVIAGPGELIVNSGDMLARLTNGVIPSTTHRVVNPAEAGESRYSMPFFLHPTSATSLAALPSCLANRTPEPPITAGEFLEERLREIGLKA